MVLTERFLAALDDADGRPLEALVALTFTEKAARELRQRIRARCRARLVAGDDRDAERWWAVLRGLDAAPIGTFHEFCARLSAPAPHAGRGRPRVRDPRRVDRRLAPGRGRADRAPQAAGGARRRPHVAGRRIRAPPGPRVARPPGDAPRRHRPGGLGAAGARGHHRVLAHVRDRAALADGARPVAPAGPALPPAARAARLGRRQDPRPTRRAPGGAPHPRAGDAPLPRRMAR